MHVHVHAHADGGEQVGNRVSGARGHKRKSGHSTENQQNLIQSIPKFTT